MTAFQTVDKGFVEKLQKVSGEIMDMIDAMDAYVAMAINRESLIMTTAWQVLTDGQVKDMEAIAQKRQEFLKEQKTLEAAQFAKPSTNYVQEATLKMFWPQSEALTRAMRQQLYADHTQRTELMSEQFYSDKTNLVSNLGYDKGTISGIAKLYNTHKEFFCNAAGAQKPAACGDKAANSQMGDQMLEIYLGDQTWPEEQVQKSVELMQFYLGISPPDLPNTADFSTGEGQRAYLDYQGNLARNNFLTYIMSYLVSKRAPTNNAQEFIIDLRKNAAGCPTTTAASVSIGAMPVCQFLDALKLKYSGKASKAELSKALEFDRFMNPAFIPKAISGTLGIEKDLTLLMVDRLGQDYEAYQMDKMMTASLAGYYASLVNRPGR